LISIREQKELNWAAFNIIMIKFMQETCILGVGAIGKDLTQSYAFGMK
jgi:hypothetical protein